MLEIKVLMLFDLIKIPRSEGICFGGGGGGAGEGRGWGCRVCGLEKSFSWRDWVVCLE